jgi:hypothetical protein
MQHIKQFESYLAACREYWASQPDAQDMVGATPRRLWLFTPQSVVTHPFPIGEEIVTWRGANSNAPQGANIVSLTPQSGDERQARRLITWTLEGRA